MSSMQVGIEVIELEDKTNRTIDDEKRTADEVRNKYSGYLRLLRLAVIPCASHLN